MNEEQRRQGEQLLHAVITACGQALRKPTNIYNSNSCNSDHHAAVGYFHRVHAAFAKTLSM